MDDNVNNPTMTAPPPAQPTKRFGGIGRRAALAVTAVGLLTGGLAGGFVVSHAATTTTAASTTAATPGAGTSAGKFVSNENAAHEAGESAAREAQENAGQIPTVP